MPQKIKCRQCGNIALKSSAIELKPRIFVCSEQCKLDYEDEHKPKEPKPKPDKPPVESAPKSVAPMRQLTDYVQTYAPDTDWVRFVAQAKSIMKEYNMTPSGIQYTLWYMREHQRLALDGDGLGLVPYWYKKAQSYYHWLQDIKQRISVWDIDDDKADTVKKKEPIEDIFD